MNKESLEELKAKFPKAGIVQTVLVPLLQRKLKAIENSWHMMDAAGKERKAYEKQTLLQLSNDLKLDLNNELPKSIGTVSGTSGLSEGLQERDVT